MRHVGHLDLNETMVKESSPITTLSRVPLLPRACWVAILLRPQRAAGTLLVQDYSVTQGVYSDPSKSD